MGKIDGVSITDFVEERLIDAATSYLTQKVLAANPNVACYTMPSADSVGWAIHEATDDIVAFRIQTNLGAFIETVDLGKLCRTFVLRESVNPLDFMPPQPDAVVKLSKTSCPNASSKRITLKELEQVGLMVGDVVYIPHWHHRWQTDAKVGWYMAEVALTQHQQ